LVPLLIGLAELASGRAFGELARDWDELAGWQRGVLGVAIVGIVGAAIVLGIGVVLSFVVS